MNHSVSDHLKLKFFPFLGLLLFCLVSFAMPAWAFCGFYVAKADTSLYNRASQVAIARDGDRTVLTMANDYQGEVADFAMVVPVPVVLQEDQVKVADPTILDRLDAFSAPRLVEYFDENPCAPRPYPEMFRLESEAPVAADGGTSASNQALGVTVESSFSVGEYDILILSARESDGLQTWLRENDYRIPDGASSLLQPYIRQGMKFFVAKVNLQEFDQQGFQSLRPLQMSYESPRFMLPIRLGMINAESEQDLVVYLLSRNGRTELTNYRAVPIPSDANIPLFVKDEFNDFYTDMFQRSYEREGKNVAFLEYAWNMGNCDPCSADPLTPEELSQAGVFWTRPGEWPSVFISRLHVRYTRNKFPEDLMFQETSNQQQFQGRYVLTHAYLGPTSCPAGEAYRRQLPQRFEQEAQSLARLTGWNINDIRRQLPQIDSVRTEQPRFEAEATDSWWQSLWSLLSL
ncbi:DUF2330 domain-containing protein [Romeria aff. gracilis LEGE 07310]|uniref:DUF2330 domain-containing protein n=2 Tax=Vasconcelosia TaxID=3366328 RepID=A0A8J7AGB2_9CYAN|nr:DUF2330 domain-containing protein [Romeria aff. gracilis LEGE 07310]